VTPNCKKNEQSGGDSHEKPMMGVNADDPTHKWIHAFLKTG